jgi:hypothetical protein
MDTEPEYEPEPASPELASPEPSPTYRNQL